eukprot:TRINITY_DN40689_c0_g1_i2.p1 TRINITY_DN40689_c0_g1~~TRINITY_DN40689_c0_g1_i2.p1  ORF type:complete len:2791 (+),score=696.32 TRINITY_DN40689_c0_g1_i2:36-8375(+)
MLPDAAARLRRALRQWRAPTSEHLMLINSISLAFESMRDKTLLGQMVQGIFSIAQSLKPPAPDPIGAVEGLIGVAGAALSMAAERFSMDVYVRIASLRALRTQLGVALELPGASLDPAIIPELYAMQTRLVESEGATWETLCQWVRLLSTAVTGVGRVWGPERADPDVVSAAVHGGSALADHSGRGTDAPRCPPGFLSLRRLALLGCDEGAADRVASNTAEGTLGLALWARERQRVLQGELGLAAWLRQGLSAVREALAHAAYAAAGAARLRFRGEVAAFASGVQRAVAGLRAEADGRLGVGWPELLDHAAAGREGLVHSALRERVARVRRKALQADEPAAPAPRAAQAWRQLGGEAVRVVHAYVDGAIRPAEAEVRELERVVTVCRELLAPLGQVEETAAFFRILGPTVDSVGELVAEARDGVQRANTVALLMQSACEHARELAACALTLTRLTEQEGGGGEARAEAHRRAEAVREQARAFLECLGLCESSDGAQAAFLAELDEAVESFAPTRPGRGWFGKVQTQQEAGGELAPTLAAELAGAAVCAAMAAQGRMQRHAEGRVLAPLHKTIVDRLREALAVASPELEVVLDRVEEAEQEGERAWRHRRSSRERLANLGRLQQLTGDALNSIQDKVEERLDAMIEGPGTSDHDALDGGDDEEGFGVQDVRPLWSMATALRRRSSSRNQAELWRVQQSAVTALMIYHSTVSQRLAASAEDALSGRQGLWLERQRRAVSGLLTRLRVLLTDARVRAALDATQYADSVVAATLEGWTDTKAEMERTIRRHMTELRRLQESVAEEGDVVRQKHLLLCCKEEAARLALVARNCSSIGEQTGLVIEYMTQLATDLAVVQAQNKRLQQSMSRVEESLQRVEFDTRRMAGLPLHQLLRREWQQWRHVAGTRRHTIWIDPPAVRIGANGEHCPSDQSSGSDDEGMKRGASSGSTGNRELSGTSRHRSGTDLAVSSSPDGSWRGALRRLVDIVDGSTGRVVLRTPHAARGASVQERFGITLEEVADTERPRLRVTAVRRGGEAHRCGLRALLRRSRQQADRSFSASSSGGRGAAHMLGATQGTLRTPLWGLAASPAASSVTDRLDTELESLNGQEVRTLSELAEAYEAASKRHIEVCFTGPPATQVVFLSAEAGAGKTYALDRLHDHLWARLGEQMKSNPRPSELRPWVVPLRSAMGAMRNPLGNFVGEALDRRGYLPAQGAEFRAHARAGRIRVVLIADGYDESPAVAGKNVYSANDLEELSTYQEGDAAVPGPCLIIGGRQSAVSHAGYQRLFHPVVSTAPDRYRPDQHFTEIRLGGFGPAVGEYVRQHVRLHPDGWSMEQWLRSIDSVLGLRDQLSTPLMVRMTMEVLTHLTGRGVSIVDWRQKVLIAFPDGENHRIWRAVRSFVELAFDPPAHTDMASVIETFMRNLASSGGSGKPAEVLATPAPGTGRRSKPTPSEVVANIHLFLRLLQQGPERPAVLTDAVCDRLERECFREHSISRFDIYLQFMERFKHMQKERLDAQGGAVRVDAASFHRDIDTLATRLAALMLADGLVVCRQAPGRLFREKGEYDQFLDTAENPYLEALLRCLPLQRVGEECRWGHRSYLEYNGARFVCDVVDRLLAGRAPGPVELARGARLWRALVGDSGVMNFLAELCRGEGAFAERALSAAQQCKVARGDPGADVGGDRVPAPTLASVLLSALADAGRLTPDAGVTLEGVALPHARLGGAVLGGIKFIGCDLRYCQFARSRMEGAALVDCWCAGATAGELARTDMPHRVECIAIVNAPESMAASGRLLACGLGNGDVELFDPVRGARARLFRKCHDREVTAIGSYADRAGRTVLVTGSPDMLIRRWHIEDGSAAGDQIQSSHKVWALTTYRDDSGGAIIAAGSVYNTLRQWAADDGSPYGEALAGHTGPVRALTTYRARGGATVLVSGSADGTIRQWHAQSGAPVGLPLQGHASRVCAVAAYTDQGGTTVLVSGSGDRTVRRWRAADGIPFGNPIKAHGDDVTALAVFPGGGGAAPVLVSGSADATVKRWRADDGTQVGEPLPGHTQPITGLAVLEDAPGGAMLISASLDHSVRRWRTDDTAASGADGHTASVRALISYVDRGGAPIVASGSFDGTVRYWRADDGAPIGILYRHGGPVRALARYVDKRGATVLASGSSSSGEVTVCRWRPGDNNSVLKPFTGHSDIIRAIVSYSDSRGNPMLATGSADGTVLRWHCNSGAPHGQPLLAVDSVSALAWYTAPKGGTVLVAASGDFALRRWHAESGDALGAPLAGHADGIRCVVAYQHVTGRTVLASASDDATIRLWCTEESRALGEPLTGHRGFVNAIVISRLRRAHSGIASVSEQGAVQLVSASSDNTVRQWEPAAGPGSGREVGTAVDLGSAVVSLCNCPANSVAAGLSSGSIALLRPTHAGVLRTVCICGSTVPFSAVGVRSEGCSAGPLPFAAAVPGMRVRLVPSAARSLGPRSAEVLARKQRSVAVRWADPADCGPPHDGAGRGLPRETEEPREWWDGEGGAVELGGDASDFLAVLAQRSSVAADRQRRPASSSKDRRPRRGAANGGSSAGAARPGPGAHAEDMPGDNEFSEPRRSADFAVGSSVVHKIRGTGVVIAVDARTVSVRFLAGGDQHTYRNTSLEKGTVQPLPRPEAAAVALSALSALAALSAQGRLPRDSTGSDLKRTAKGPGGWFVPRRAALSNGTDGAMQAAPRPLSPPPRVSAAPPPSPMSQPRPCGEASFSQRTVAASPRYSPGSRLLDQGSSPSSPSGIGGRRYSRDVVN